MEYVGLMKKIDDEFVGESWIDSLIAQFNFPKNPQLFHHLLKVNQRLEEIERNEGKEDCGCSIPPLQDFWCWTKHFPLEKTKVVILNGEAGNNNVKLLEDSMVELMKQGVLVFTHYVNPDCKARGEHTDWGQIVYNLIEFMANNLPMVQFLLDGDVSLKTYDRLIQNRLQRIRGNNVLGKLKLKTNGHVEKALEKCNKRLVGAKEDPILWKC